MRQSQLSIEQVDALVRSAGPGPWTRGVLQRQGWTHSAIRAAVRAGRIHRLQHGVYAVDQTDLSTTIRAALAKAGAGAAVSHETAAIVRTLWLPRRPSSLIHLTRGGAIDRTHQGVRLHGSWYASEFGWEKERVLGEVDGIEKYGRTGDEVTAAVRAERLRQADLQDAGWAFARWTPSERRAVVIRRIARTLGL